MTQLLRLGTALLSFIYVATSHPMSKRDDCTNPRQVKPWSDLTADEQQSYIDATSCLLEQPAQLGIGGAVSRWDELQYIHVHQAGWIHFVGHFLPWHRYFVAVHANLLRDECGYDGPLPYWDETSDAALDDISTAAVFQPGTFGGDGVGDTQCIDDSFLASVSLHAAVEDSPNSPETTVGNTCIFRQLSRDILQYSNSTNVDTCLAAATFVDVWQCIENGPHVGGHGGAGGLMGNPAYSTGDPLFFMHHAFIDRIWARWQAQDPDTRLTEIGGNVVPTDNSNCTQWGETCATPAVLDYDGDDGETTTLNHVLWMMDIYPNVTAADVMDAKGSIVCLDYLD